MRLLSASFRPAAFMPAAFKIAVFLVVCFVTAGPAKAQEIHRTERHDFILTRVASGFEHPWGMAFLPDGRLIVTEREGDVRIVDPKSGDRGAKLEGVPKAAAVGQGGMLDVALDPNFNANRLIYLSYSAESEGDSRRGLGTVVSRGRLADDASRLENIETIFEMTPFSSVGRHFGSRLVFGNDGALFITLGDRGERDRVQDFSIHRGQIVRINPDGSVPADNPFVNR